MNWDWEKLQEKRQRGSGQQPKPKRDDEEPFGQKGGGGRGPGGGGPNLGQMGDAFKNIRNLQFKTFRLGLLIVVLAWLASGIFIVDPDEKGVVLRFGKYDRTVEPGPHYRLPYPIEESFTPRVTHVQRVEIGFRTIRTGRDGQTSTVRPVLEEAAMLTGDENIVNVQFIVQYQIKNPVDFLFNVDLQIPRSAAGQDMYSESVKNAAEAAMREVIGGSKIDAALTDGKTKIQDDCRLLLQSILDRYTAGIYVQTVQMQDVHPPKEVGDAFKDVASAREDRSRTINEAEAYMNEVIPKTRGEAAEIINQAEAYKATVINRAEGEAARFLTVLAEYNKAKEITKKRMYYEAMEEILSAPGLEKLVISKGTTNGILPYLPLERMQQGGK